MAWADVFPILDDDMVARYENHASAAEKERLSSFFEVESVFGQKSSSHLASLSLFWKPMRRTDPDYPAPTRSRMKNPMAHGLSTRFGNPWNHYVDPILRAARLVSEDHPGVTLRVYLARDLSFLTDELVDAGCEVFLMESPSLRACPGMIWRFLAMEERKLVTVIDSDLAETLPAHLERTQLMADGGLGYWRTPYQPSPCEPHHGNPGWYRTSVGTHSGAQVTLPVTLLAEAFLWNLEHGYLRSFCTVDNREMPIWGGQWPDYGFDEFFLNTAIYPRVVPEGVLTFVNQNQVVHNYWLALDIEHCLKANPASEMIFWTDHRERTSSAE